MLRARVLATLASIVLLVGGTAGLASAGVPAPRLQALEHSPVGVPGLGRVSVMEIGPELRVSVSGTGAHADQSSRYISPSGTGSISLARSRPSAGSTGAIGQTALGSNRSAHGATFDRVTHPVGQRSAPHPPLGSIPWMPFALVFAFLATAVGLKRLS